MATSDLTAERLRDVLDYNPETGVFTWRLRTRKTKPGQRAGYVAPHGYVFIQVDGHMYTAHRLAWLYVHGNWPAFNIDHFNGVRADNRINNLRDVPQALNVQNTTMARRDSKTGVRGVFWDRSREKFVVAVKANGRSFRARVDTMVEAKALYDEVKRRMCPESRAAL